jgi:hypothetical protein
MKNNIDFFFVYYNFSPIFVLVFNTTNNKEIYFYKNEKNEPICNNCGSGTYTDIKGSLLIYIIFAIISLIAIISAILTY